MPLYALPLCLIGFVLATTECDLLRIEAPICEVACAAMPLPAWRLDSELAKLYCLSLRHHWLEALGLSTGSCHFSNACYLNIPKTASTSTKGALQLPRRYYNLELHTWQPTCRSVLATVKDPMLRFVSALGTVWYRTDPSSASPWAPPQEKTLANFILYAHRSLDTLSKTLTSCTAMDRLGIAMHLLPQSTFIAPTCHPALQPNSSSVESIHFGPTPGASVDELIRAIPCAKPPLHKNPREGAAAGTWSGKLNPDAAMYYYFANATALIPKLPAGLV